LYCGNSLDPNSYAILMEDQKAAAVFTDAPYNRSSSQIGGRGRTKHPSFKMAAGELSKEEFVDFLTSSLKLMCQHTVSGAIIFEFIDWRGLGAMLTAGEANGCDLINLCCWIKSHGGMGSFYRSMHELVLVFRNGKQPHLNMIMLGKYGRPRTNVWRHPGANGFPRKGEENALSWHPTVKPLALVADAILDCTKRNDIVLDPFIGSGTTILAAERTGRRGFGIEINPTYVDTTIARWEKMSGQPARTADGTTFAQTKLNRSSGQ
jgi:DNA modification methylase